MINRNYLCSLELIAFDDNVMKYGADMLRIRLEKIIKDINYAASQRKCPIKSFNMGSRLVFMTHGDDDETLSDFLSFLFDYNKQAILFGYPHKGVLLLQEQTMMSGNGVEVVNSKALIESEILLGKQNIAGISTCPDLFERKKDIMGRYFSFFDGFILLNLIRHKLADIALSGMTSSVESNFAKIGIKDSFCGFSDLKDNVCKFLREQNK